MTKSLFLIIFILIFAACNGQLDNQPKLIKHQSISLEKNATFIHVFVALCDNEHQGIVPVPAKIGNGLDYNNNLYWGCKYGVNAYFKNSKDWQWLETKNIDNTILQRSIFKHKKTNTYLIADAYNGAEIKQCTKDFLQACAGQNKKSLTIQQKNIGTNGNANIVAYIGHDGLMDFTITEQYKAADTIKRKAIILACFSKKYFAPHLAATSATPLLWSTGLMSPEAYILHDALQDYLLTKNPTTSQIAAAKAYSKYQKCSFKAASNLIVCH